MQPGELNRKIYIQSKTTAYDSYNDPIDVWSDDFYCHAMVTTTGGSEFYAAQRLNAATTALFKIRYTRRVTALNRIRYGERIFEILPPINDVNERHEVLLISAKEVI